MTVHTPERENYIMWSLSLSFTKEITVIGNVLENPAHR